VLHLAPDGKQNVDQGVGLIVVATAAITWVHKAGPDYFESVPIDLY